MYSRNFKLLIADDDPNDRELMICVLKNSFLDCRVECAGTGETFLAMLDSGGFDLAVLDYNMPGMNGLEALAEVSRLNCDTAVIMVTGMGDERVAVDAIKNGAYDYINKSGDYFASLPHIAKNALERLELKREQRRLKKELQKSQKRYLELVEGSLDFIYLSINIDRRITGSNSKATSILGFSQEELQDMHVDMLFAPDKLEELHQIFKILTGSPSISGIESGIMKKNGKRVDVEISAAARLDENGELLGFQAVLQDITERKRSEEVLRESEELHRITLGSISDAVFITDDAGEFSYICPNVEPVFGYSHEEAQQLGNIACLLGNMSGIPERLKDVPELKNLERIITDKFGKARTVLINVKRVAIRNGTLLYTCHDITERVMADLRISQLSAKILRSQDEERQRVARELHDSVGQTMLASKLNLEAYNANPTKYKERFNTGLELIDQAARELREIYTALYPSILQHLGLNAAIRWYSKNYLETRHIQTKFNLSLEEKLPHYLEVNLYRIIQESFSNIVKHSHADRVNIDLARTDDKHIRMMIEDNGIGFSSADVKGGQAFGLENIRCRAEDMQGSLDIDSRVDGGTSITVTIPFASGDFQPAGIGIGGVSG